MPTRHDRQAFAAGMLLGISLTGLGVVLAQAVFGPVLARSLSSTEEQILADVHDRLMDDYVVPLDNEALMREGGTREELAEMLAMCVQMGGGPVLMYAAKALEAWDDLAED